MTWSAVFGCGPTRTARSTFVGGSTYRYTATCAGYIGTQGTMVASAEAAAQNVRLEKAPAARSVAVTSTWPSFRGGDDSNSVVTAKTPVTTDTAILSWANKLGNGFSGEALGCPILITENGYDYLIVYQTNQLLKVDALSGTVVARAQMDHGSDFAINSATFAEGMLFVGLSNGSVQAFYADTLQSAWLYTDPLGGQPNCPITYHDGYIYTGFWVSETAIPITSASPLPTRIRRRPARRKLASLDLQLQRAASTGRAPCDGRLSAGRHGRRRHRLYEQLLRAFVSGSENRRRAGSDRRTVRRYPMQRRKIRRPFLLHQQGRIFLLHLHDDRCGRQRADRPRQSENRCAEQRDGHGAVARHEHLHAGHLRRPRFMSASPARRSSGPIPATSRSLTCLHGRLPTACRHRAIRRPPAC